MVEQELINNYWNLPVPKCSSKGRFNTVASAMAFNEVIAQNNNSEISKILLEDAHEFDELLDCALVENGEVCSILDIIRGQESPIKKRKKSHLVPLTFVKFDTKSTGKGKPITIKALLDSGGSETVVSEKYATKLKRVKSTPMRWSTPGGNMTTTEVVRARISLDEFIPNKKIYWNMHVVKDLGAYDMIIGRDMLTDLGIDICFSDQVSRWEYAELPFKELDATTDAYHIHEPEVVQKATNRVKEIFQARMI